jgi:hypothetical protein
MRSLNISAFSRIKKIDAVMIGSSLTVKTGSRGSNSGALEVTPEGENVGIVGRNRNSEGLGRKLGRDRRSRRMEVGSWKVGAGWTWSKLVR